MKKVRFSAELSVHDDASAEEIESKIDLMLSGESCEVLHWYEYDEQGEQ